MPPTCNLDCQHADYCKTADLPARLAIHRKNKRDVLCTLMDCAREPQMCIKRLQPARQVAHSKIKHIGTHTHTHTHKGKDIPDLTLCRPNPIDCQLTLRCRTTSV